MYAQVYIDAASAAADKVYEYKIPVELSDVIKPAMRVGVPFGRSNKLSQAFVVSVSENTDYDEKKLKSIAFLADTQAAIPDYLVKTAVFLRESYFCSYGEAIRCVLPSADKLKKRVSYAPAQSFDEKFPLLADERDRLICETVKKRGSVSFNYLKGKTALSSEELVSRLASLSDKGLIFANEEFISENKEQFDEYVSLAGEDNELEDYLMLVGSRAKKQREIVSYLFNAGEPVLKSKLYAETSSNSAHLKTLSENNLIEISEKPKVYLKQEKIDPYVRYALSDEQQAALNAYHSRPTGSRFLLFGVTGSGKTHLFFEMFDEMLKCGKQCLLLVPEISLTPQMMRLVRSRFSQGVAIMHSKLTPAERYSEFLKIKRGEAKIVLGARSALFMPFKNLGIIVIDEQHENSYRASNSPRYDTIETAEFICTQTGASLVLASATPSTAAYHKALLGEYDILKLTKRVNKSELPNVDIVDMRTELREGNRSPLSRELSEKITDRLEKKEQTLLFLNRRGYNTYVFCRSCGYIEMCPNCEVSLTSHASSNTLRCHYCGFSKPVPHICPQCGSEKIKFMGTGTEKIQQVVAQSFPEARILRLDSDTAGGRDAHERILSAFARGEADILIGTQMIVKGLDFANVTLVGILLADSSLNFPDINAAARTFQLTAQAAGRAGRRETGGEVVMQTYKPEDPTLVYASQHDYESFYAYDINFRQSLNYPPFSEILGFFCANEDENKCIAEAQSIYERISEIIADLGESYKLYEPAPAFIQKLKNKYIHHVLLRILPDSEIKRKLRENLDVIRKGLSSYVYVEKDPVTLL